MKVAHVIHCCSPGGAEIYIKNLLISMKKQYTQNDYQLWVIYKAKYLYNGNENSVNFETDFIEDLTKNGIRVKFISKQDGLMNRLKMIRKINKIYSEFKPDVIHCHLETVTFHIVSSLLFRKVKMIETIHNTKINRPKLHKYFLNYKINKFVSIADSVTDIIKQNINVSDNKIVKIYNGIDIDKFICDRLHTNLDRPKNIVAIGRLTEQKNHLLLIKSFAKLIDKCEKENIVLPYLNIYGQGELEDILKKFVEENKIKNVQFKGITKDIPTVLKTNDIYVMSSIYEGFSISLIEALVSGIAIICTDVGGNREIIDNNITGVIVNSNDEDQLTESMYMLLKDMDKRKLFNDNCNINKNKYSVKYCANEHIKMYLNVNESI